MAGKSSLSARTALLSLIVYLGASVLLTWPLVLHLDTAVFGAYGDSFGDIWSAWGRANALWSSDPPGTQLIAAPFGISVGPARHPILDAVTTSLARGLGEIVGHNLFILLAFALTAFATMLCLAFILRNGRAAFFGGLVFGFCPAAVMQATAGHLAFVLNATIPLLLLALFYNQRRRNLASAALLGLSYALLTLTSLYWGYFGIHPLVGFIVYDALTTSGSRGLRFWGNYACAASVAGLLIIPFLYPWLVSLGFTGAAQPVQTGLERSLIELVTLSARPWEYLLPSIDHPVLGRLVEGFMRSHLHGSNIPEQTLYLGLIPLALSVKGLRETLKRRLDHDSRLLWLFIAGAIWMAFLSAPPYIPIGRLKIPMLSYLSFLVAPQFRAYCRAGIWVNFFIACAAAATLAQMETRMSQRRRLTLWAACCFLLAFEYWSVPARLAASVKTPPPVYQWLARQPGDFIIAEYPMMPGDEAAVYTYYFWQRVHRKRLVNGATPSNRRAWSLFEQVRDLSKPEAIRLLKEIGVRYIIVHPEMYAQGQIPAPIKRYFPPHISSLTYDGGASPANPSLKTPVKTFGDVLVFAL